MKVVVLCLLLAAFIGCSQAFSLRQLVGICAEMCSSDRDCGPGMHCSSNGCGHTCQHSILPGTLKDCRFRPICDIYCPKGQATDENGCPTCSCNPVDVAIAL